MMSLTIWKIKNFFPTHKSSHSIFSAKTRSISRFFFKMLIRTNTELTWVIDDLEDDSILVRNNVSNPAVNELTL